MQFLGTLIFGRCAKPGWIMAGLSVFVGALLFCACSSDKKTASLSWNIEASDEIRRELVVAKAEIIRGGCSGNVIAYSEVFSEMSSVEAPEVLGEGTFGFRVSARNANCEWFADGCIDFELPSSEESLTVTLAQFTSVEAACSAEECSCYGCPGEDISCEEPPECVTNADCQIEDEDNPCVFHTCSPEGTCEETFAGTDVSCDDNDSWTFADACDGAGNCAGPVGQCSAGETLGTVTEYDLHSFFPFPRKVFTFEARDGSVVHHLHDLWEDGVTFTDHEWETAYCPRKSNIMKWDGEVLLRSDEIDFTPMGDAGGVQYHYRDSSSEPGAPGGFIWAFSTMASGAITSEEIGFDQYTLTSVDACDITATSYVGSTVIQKTRALYDVDADGHALRDWAPYTTEGGSAEPGCVGTIRLNETTCLAATGDACTDELFENWWFAEDDALGMIPIRTKIRRVTDGTSTVIHDLRLKSVEDDT